MKIVRQTDAELIVQDSCIWVGVVCALCAGLPLWFVLVHHDRRALTPVVVLLLFAIPWMRRTNFTFDAPTQTIRWMRMRCFVSRTGSIPFSGVQAVDIQSTMSAQANGTIYRLALVTSQGTLPMSDVYSSGERRCTSVRNAIQSFLKLDAHFPAPSAGLDISIRALLQQGRKIDAIQLLRSTEKLSLTAATERVNAINASMQPAVE